jgi:hypothetical protein
VSVIGVTAMLGIVAAGPTATPGPCERTEPMVAVARIGAVATEPSEFLAAVWADGRIVRARTSRYGRQYVEGYLQPADLLALGEYVMESGYWKPNASESVADASYRLFVCIGEQSAPRKGPVGYPEDSPATSIRDYILRMRIEKAIVRTSIAKDWVRWFH